MFRLVVTWFLACAPNQGALREEPGPAAAESRRQQALTRIELKTAQVAAGLPRGEEVAGLVTALVELSLADHDGVVVTVPNLPPPPGMQAPIDTAADPWQGAISVGGTPEALRVELTLCRSAVECVTHASEAGTSAHPGLSVAEVVGASVRQIRPSAYEGDFALWDAPESRDAYAVLIAGRSAATWYAIRPPVAPALRWDKRADPIMRALYIDPSMPVAGWLAGRQAYQEGSFSSAHAYLARASFGRPTSPVLLADDAAALSAEGKAKDAWVAWQRVEELSPNDLRYAVPLARAALDAKQPREAARRLAALPDFVDRHPAVAEMRVEAADAIDPNGASDALLAAWAEAAPELAEPVLRRIYLRVAKQDYEDALRIAEDLTGRGGEAQRWTVELALLSSLHRWEEAAERAERIGRPEVARRIRARARLDGEPGAFPDELTGATEPESLVVLGRAQLDRGDAAEALKSADAALKKRKDMPSALAVRADALAALGREADATRARDRLQLVDPRWARAEPEIQGVDGGSVPAASITP